MQKKWIVLSAILVVCFAYLGSYFVLIGRQRSSVKSTIIDIRSGTVRQYRVYLPVIKAEEAILGRPILFIVDLEEP